MIDLIVPVFRGFDETRRCIESVLRARQSTVFELVLVDDATPEPEIATYLDEIAKRQGLTLLRNDHNLGFVDSVNRGMSLHADRDVVLLNSDTEVANDWLDRLNRCAYSQPDIGIVSPFSNNATICSYPFEGWSGGVPGNLGLVELDRLIAACNAGRCVDLPTAVGFCMFIRRACIERVGLFDAERFGRGYGEENDFSLRAATAGWRSVLAADVFVFHAGSVSFREERSLLQQQAMKALLAAYPDYLGRLGDFSAHNPAQPLRDAIDLARMITGPEERRQVRRERAESMRRVSKKPAQLHLTHSWDGGTNRWISDFCRCDRERRNLILRSISNRNVAAWRLELLDPSEADVPLMTWDLARPVRATDICHLEYQSVLDEIVDAFDIQTILVSSLIGHSLDVFDVELPTLVVLHDLYPFCPALFACFDAPCTECATDTLKACMKRNPYNAFWHNTSVDEWQSLREAYAKCLSLSRVDIAAPTQSAWVRWTTLFPAIAQRPCRIIPHGLDLEYSVQAVEAFPRSRAPHAKLRLVVPGRLLPHKGLGLFAQALPDLLTHADVLLLGCGSFGMPFENVPGVEIVQTYVHRELASHIDAFRPDAALMLSVVPESFSYTLSEMFALGLPVIATDLGAFAERIEPCRNGLLFAPNVAALVDLAGKLACDRDALSGMKGNLRRDATRSVAQMIHDYHGLLPVTAGTPDRSPAIGRAMLRAVQQRQQVASENRHLRDKLDQQTARVAALDTELSELRLRCIHLEYDVSHLQAERGEIFRSRSWRWTAPLRGLSDALRAFKTIFAAGASRSTVERGESPSPTLAAHFVSDQFRFEEDGRDRARRELRQQIGVPDACKVVLSLLLDATASANWIGLLARGVTAIRNDTVFLLTPVPSQSKPDFGIESAALVAMRKILFLADSEDLSTAIAGSDVLLFDRVESARRYLSLTDSGTRLLVLRSDREAVRDVAETKGAMRFVYHDAIDSVSGIFSNWFGESN